MKTLNTIELKDEEFENTTEVALSIIDEESEERKPVFKTLSSWFEKAKLKPFPWKKINAKNAMIAGCLVLIAVAGYLNIRYGIQPDVSVEPPVAEESSKEIEEDFFTSAVIDRERARGEALEVLVSITEDELADQTAKTDAFTQMERIANETSWEIDIENLVKAKGFSECVAVINQNSASIVVESEGLTAGEIAQIKEIVYLEASIQPKDIKIIEKSAM